MPIVEPTDDVVRCIRIITVDWRQPRIALAVVAPMGIEVTEGAAREA